MEPLQASWLVKACCILHNRCLDWGLRKIPPGQHIDPEHEAGIQKEAQQRFEEHNKGIDAENVPEGVDASDLGPTREGIARRDRYIYYRYGGARPATLDRVTRGRGRGARRGRGRGRGRGPQV